MSHVDNRTYAYYHRMLHTAPAPSSFASDCIDSSGDNLTLVYSAQTEVTAVSHSAQQEARGKYRGPTHSASANYHQSGLNLPKSAGKCNICQSK